MGAAAGAWKPVARGTFDANGTVQDFKPVDAPGFIELMAPPEDAKEGAFFSAVMDSSWNDVNWRFVAHDDRGMAHRLHEGRVRDIREEGKPLRQRYDFIAEPPTKAKLVSLRLDVRRYHYAEFQNVTLLPGRKTDLRVVTGVRGEASATQPAAAAEWEVPGTAEQVAEYHRTRTGEVLSREMLKKLYTDQAIQFAQTGGDPHELEAAVRRALAFEQDELTLVQLHVCLGDAYWRQTANYSPEVWRPQRYKAAIAYMDGLAQVLSHELPAQPPELPAAELYPAESLPGEDAAQRIQRVMLEGAARQRAELVGKLVAFRQVLTGQLVQMYARQPDDFEQLRQLALVCLGSEEPATALVAGAKAYRADAHSPIPVLSLPVAWGKPVNGLQAGLRYPYPCNRSYRIGEGIVDFLLLVRNTGDKAVTLVDHVPLTGWPPTIRTMDGRSISVNVPRSDGPVQLRKTVLRPGETLEVGLIQMRIGHDGRLPSAPLEPGKYLVSHVHRFGESGEATWSGELTTGELTLSVAPAETPATQSSPETMPANSEGTPPAGPPEAIQSAAEWGEAVEGVQVRLRAQKEVWKSGESPVLLADVRNDGKHEQTVGADGITGWTIELDGEQFTGPFITGIQPTLSAGQQRSDIAIHPKAVFIGNL